MTTPADPRVGTDLGPYRIEALIGRGGMGVVYLAEQPSLGRKVALKVIAPEFSDDPTAKARFLRESQMAAAIDHPNILPIYEAGDFGGVLFIAMRYVDGEDLARRTARERITLRSAVTLLAQVAAALDAAHARGLIHRDVKPANILIDPSAGPDSTDHVYLTDFGLTKHRGSQTDLTGVGGFMGTLAYISPEQIEGRVSDGRADQYALAAVAVGCLTGEPPYPRDSDVAIINAHLRDTPPSIHQRRPDLPASADAVILRGLAKRPEERYPSCKVFVDDLRTALGLTEIETRARSVSSQDRRVALLMGTLVLSILAAVAFGLAVTSGAGPNRSPSGDVSVTSSLGAATAPATSDGFPNAAEATLLAGLPIAVAATCQRGSYAPLLSRVPNASVGCGPSADLAANTITVQQFRRPVPGRSTLPRDVLRSLAGSSNIRDGDCATSEQAYGAWSVNDQETGGTLCYIDRPTGDAILYWTYDDDLILVKAVNQRGDSAALYDYFQQIARFFDP